MAQAFTPVIVVHAGAAAAALALGAAMLAARKGTLLHRFAGRGWVALMLVTALSSFWIRSSGSFSWIHILSVAVPLLLAIGVWYAITGRIAGHRRMMSGVYAGGLLIAGAFTLRPSRLLGQMLWSSLGIL